MSDLLPGGPWHVIGSTNAREAREELSLSESAARKKIDAKDRKVCES
jgi:hypothetical protein